MDAIFVVGLCLEVAGAFLLAVELLTFDPEELASRGNVYPQSGEPHLWAQRPAARTFAGFGLLVLGFTVQIVGYAVDGGVWLLLLAVGVAVGGVLVGRLLADHALAPWLYRRAVRYRRRETSAP